jgi:predicted metallo-beta-lactamase superfamily hydrolase
MEPARLVAIQTSVGKLERVAQARALKVLLDHQIPYDENGNGVFVNLSAAPESAVAELEKYLEYVRLQQEFLAEREAERDNLVQNYFKNPPHVHGEWSGSSTAPSSSTPSSEQK